MRDSFQGFFPGFFEGFFPGFFEGFFEGFFPGFFEGFFSGIVYRDSFQGFFEGFFKIQILVWHFLIICRCVSAADPTGDSVGDSSFKMLGNIYLGPYKTSPQPTTTTTTTTTTQH